MKTEKLESGSDKLDRDIKLRLVWIGLALIASGTVFISQTFAVLAVTAGLFLSVISIAFPIKVIGIQSRGFAALLAVTFFLAMLFVGAQLPSSEERLAALKASDPQAYQEEMERLQEADDRRLARLQEANHRRLVRDREEREARAAQRRLENAANERDREAGFHCLSPWDGSHDGLKRAVKDKLRNPKSFEHVETTITPNNGGSHLVKMTYRAENGFGGINVEQAYATVANSDCSFEIVGTR